MADIDEDEVERLIEELEGTTPPYQKKKKKSADGGSADRSTPGSASALLRQLEFSTYAVPPEDEVDLSQQLEEGFGKKARSPQRNAAGSAAAPAQLPALPGGRGGGQRLRSKVLEGNTLNSTDAFQELGARKEVLGQGAPQEAAGKAAADEDGADEDATPNFLPVMHGRALGTLEGITPRPRWGSSLTPVRDELFLFGGVAGSDATNDAFTLNVSRGCWEPVFVAKGSAPPPRTQHTCVSHKSTELVVFGGNPQAAAEPLLSDVHIYDTSTQTWDNNVGASSSNHSPSGRYGHTSVIHNDRMYVFGGKCMPKDEKRTSHVLSNDTFVFDLRKRAWKKKLVTVAAADETPAKSAGEAGKVKKVKVAPPKRVNHASCVHKDRMFIHGGEGSAGPLSDLWALDLFTMEWTCIIAERSTATPLFRSKHALVACGDALLIIGGAQDITCATRDVLISVLPLDAPQQWIPVALGTGTSVHPSKRHFAFCAYHGFLYLFGGVEGPGQATNAMWRFLAMDGIPVATSQTAIADSMRAMRATHAMEDVAVVTTSGRQLGLQKFMLAARAPILLEMLQKCRNENEGKAGSPPLYAIEGNTRVKGLSIAVTGDQFDALLEYLYTGSLSFTEEGDPHIKFMCEASGAFRITHLADAMAEVTAGGTDVPFEERCHRARVAGRERLLKDLRSLLPADGPAATVQLLFKDPHTQQQQVVGAHAGIVMNACDAIRSVLRPVAVDGKATHQIGDIVAKSSGRGRRGCVLGPIAIPLLSVRHVMAYLYTRELRVPSEAAFPTMLAAHTLHLPLLQAHCESIVAREDVNFESCCHLFTVARNYNAPMLQEVALLTAAVGCNDSAVDKSIDFRNLPAADQTAIKSVAAALKGKFAPLPEPQTQQKTAEEYTTRIQHRM